MRIRIGSGRWRGFLAALLALAWFLGSGGVLLADAFIREDRSSSDIYNIPGENLESGEQLDFWHTWMNKARISGVEKVDLAKRAFTFVASGSDEGNRVMSLRYYWDEGSTDPNKHQHSWGVEKEILKSPGWDGPLFWTFKTSVFNDMLYLFFATEKGKDSGNDLADGAICYMRAGAVPQGQALRFEDQELIGNALARKKRIPDPSNIFSNHRRICATGVMNGRMYVIAAVCNNPSSGDYRYDWYSNSTEDGETWDGWKQIKANDKGFPQSSTVFFASNPAQTSNPAYQVMAIGWVQFEDNAPEQSRAVLTFFDGQRLYSEKALDGTTHNIRLASGTVKGAVNDRQVVQIWRTDMGQHQKTIYHGQYAPSGPKGDEGQIVLNEDRSPWRQIVQEGYWTARTDPWYGFDNPNVRFWTHKRALESWSTAVVYGDYDSTNDQMQQFIDLTFFQKWVYWFGKGDRPYIKTLHYASDMMKPEGGPLYLQSWDLNYKEAYKGLWVFLGVVEGPPPIPQNGHSLQELTEMFTRASIGQDSTKTFAETFTANQEFTISFGYGGGGKQPLLAPMHKGGGGIGGHFMQERQKTDSITHGMNKTVTIDTTSVPPSADLGQLVVMKPKIKNQRYCLYGFDGQHDLGLKYNLLSVTEAKVSLEPYSLTDPDSRWYSAGMAKRSLTTDYAGWTQKQPMLSSRHYETVEAEGDLESGLGAGSSLVYLRKDASETNTNSYGFDFGLNAQICYVLQMEFKANFTWTYTNNATLSNNVQWGLVLPPLQGEGPGIRKIRVQPYFLQAKSTDGSVWWIPTYFRDRGVQPWCITYQVTEYVSEQDAPSRTVDSAPGSASLTVALPMGGGSVRSAYLDAKVGESRNFTVTSGDAIDLTAEARQVYVFRRWVVKGEDLLSHGSLSDSQTWVMLKRPGTMSTVEAVFERVTPTVTIRLTDSAPLASHADVSGCVLDERLLDFNPREDRLSLTINGYSLDCNRRNGAWKKVPSGYVYVSKQPGDFILALDFDSMTWSFYSKDRRIHKTMVIKGEKLKLGLTLNDESFSEKLPARIKYAFKARRLRAPGSASARADGTPFKVLTLSGSYDSGNPENNVVKAEGSMGNVRRLKESRLEKYGVVAFYVGDSPLIKARISDFVFDSEAGTYSFKDDSHEMTFDLTKGTWSLSVTGADTNVITDDMVATYLIIYDDSPNKPGMNLGLGEQNLKIMWGAG
ncbi:MAG: hypothetical protein ACLGPL_11815, partial [Acidobacteriota bacterium]